MLLSIKDRLTIVGLLPLKGDLGTMKLMRAVAQKVAMTLEEQKDINLRIEDGRYLWDAGKNQDKEVEFTHTEEGFLKDCVARLDKTGEVTADILDTCLRLAEEKESS